MPMLSRGVTSNTAPEASTCPPAPGSGAAGVGYLLKDQVADVGEFVEALSRVAARGTALDPEVVHATHHEILGYPFLIPNCR